MQRPCDDVNHRDKYLEQQVASGEVIRARQSNINMYYSPQPAAPHLQLKLCLQGSWPGRYMRTDNS